MLRKRQGESLGFPGPESLCCHVLGFLPHLPLERDAHRKLERRAGNLPQPLVAGELRGAWLGLGLVIMVARTRDAGIRAQP